MATTSTKPAPPLVFDIHGMDCPDCARSVERVVSELPGVQTAEVNFGAATLTVSAATSEATGISHAIDGAVSRAGYQAVARQPGAHRSTARKPVWKDRRLIPVALAAVAWIVAFTLSRFDAPEVVVDLIYAAAMVIGGASFARAALQAVKARRLDMNVLMSISAIGAAALGDWSEGAMVVVLFGLGGTLQALTLDRTRGAIRALMDLTPETAIRLHGGREVQVAVDDLEVGDLVLVKPGARVPADGLVRDGQSAVDQSAITGESMPVEKAIDDEVFAATVNGQGTLTVEVAKPPSESTFARIVHLVETAQASKAPSQQLVDRFAAVYTPAVIALAVSLAAFGLIFSDPETWIYRALVLLVIACPCALLISTPVSIVAAIGAATRRGVLVKGGAALESAGLTRVVALDKTGTLTFGRPTVTQIVPLNGRSERDVLSLAAAVESLSEHPIARATVARALHDGVEIPRARDFRSEMGRGASATVNGEQVFVGNSRWVAQTEGLTLEAESEIERLAEVGESPYVVAINNGQGREVVGLVSVADRIRSDAKDAVAALYHAGVKHVAVLTGDTRGTGEAIAAASGADEVLAELLPEEKASAVADLRARYGPVAMVGDGINDAPAFAASDIAIAMGLAGTDVALETADIALMRDDLRGVAYALDLSRRTLRIIKQNITLSLAIKLLALILAVFGIVNLWIAVAADMGTSLLVTLNGLRLAVDQGTGVAASVGGWISKSSSKRE